MKRTIQTLLHGFMIFFITAFCTLSYALPQTKNFLVISDVHLDSASTHTMHFSPDKPSSKDDLDASTFKQLLKSLHQNMQQGVIPTPKFILFLGDIVGHDRSSSHAVFDSEKSVFHTLSQQFPTTPIFYTFGNNDSFLINYGPFTSPSTHKKGPTPLDVAQKSGHWSRHFLSTGIQCQTDPSIFPCLISENTINGYYSAYIEAHFRLISLNTVLFSPQRIGIQEDDMMPQLKWLASQLEAAQSNHDAVLFTMHIPPGKNVYDNSSFWMPKEEAEFLRLIKKYRHSIIGILAGHTHKDEIKVIQDAASQPITGVYLTPALSTSHGNAPAVRTFTYAKQPSQWQLTNYDTFYFIKNIKSIIQLKKLYDYHAYYCKAQETNLTECLKNISANQMQKYFSAGNDNYHEIIHTPQNIIISTQASLKNNNTQSIFLFFKKITDWVRLKAVYYEATQLNF